MYVYNGNNSNCHEYGSNLSGIIENWHNIWNN